MHSSIRCAWSQDAFFDDIMICLESIYEDQEKDGQPCEMVDNSDRVVLLEMKGE